VADLTRPDRGEALERLTTKVQALPEDEVTPYLLLCMAILARNASDVVTFLMDRADARLDDAEAVARD
jgi:hypothetical protein